MKKLLLLMALLCASGVNALAATSAMTATVTDTDGTPWSNAKYTAILRIQGQPGITPTISGVPVSPLTVSGTADASGVISGTFTDTKSVDQPNAIWVFTLQSNTSAAAITVPVAIFGATPNLTGNFSGLMAPRFPASPSAYGYADVEVTSPSLGNTYFNTGTVCSSTGGIRQYSNAGWQCGGSGSGAVAAGTGITYYSTPGGTTVAGAGSIIGPVCGQGVAAPTACATYQSALQAITTTNMILQWPMFEGSGTVLTDTSGNGRNGTINAGPTWSGLFLDFRSNNGNIALPGSVTTFRRLDFGILIPAPQSGGAQTGDFNSYGDYSAFPANPSPFCGTNSTGLCLIAAALSGSDVAIRGGWASPRISNYFAPFQPSGGAFPLNGLTSGWHAVSFLCGSSSDGTYDTLYVDGVPQVMSFFARACPTSAPTGTYNLGGDSHATGTFYRGQIGYFAVKSQLETTTIYRDHQNILAFLAQKGAQVGLSTRNGSRTPTLTCYGDSRTNGYLSGVPLCTAIGNAANFTAGWNLISYGSNGLSAADAVSAIKNTVSSTTTPVGRSVVTVLLGTNDAPTSCTSANFIASELQGIIQQIHDLKAQVIIGTEVSATTKDTCLLTVLNPAIRANWKAWGADAMVDYGDGPMGATGAYANPTAACGGSNCYNADGLHWSAAGTNTNGALAANVHAELVGSNSTNYNVYSTVTYTMLPKDGFAQFTGGSAPTWTLVDCTGFSAERRIINPTAFAMTINPAGSQTIDGGSSHTIAAGATWRYLPVPAAAGTAGCSWVTTGL